MFTSDALDDANTDQDEDDPVPGNMWQYHPVKDLFQESSRGKWKSLNPLNSESI